MKLSLSWLEEHQILVANSATENRIAMQLRAFERRVNNALFLDHCLKLSVPGLYAHCIS